MVFDFDFIELAFVYVKISIYEFCYHVLNVLIPPAAGVTPALTEIRKKNEPRRISTWRRESVGSYT